MKTTYEVTTEQRTRRGRLSRTWFVEADDFKQRNRTAIFTDDAGQTVATIKHVVRVSSPSLPPKL